MTSQETEVSANAIAIPKEKEPINLLTGVFLKSVYFLDPELTKCAITGIVKNRDSSLGVIIKGKRGCVYWSYDSFCQLCDRFNLITLALLEKRSENIKTDEGSSIKVNNVFGNQYAYISDGEHSLSLNLVEWNQLIKNIPVICRNLLELFYLEVFIKDFIDQVLADAKEQTDELPSDVADRLRSELSIWRL